MKKILGLDLGTNSIGWSLIEHNFVDKKGKIKGLGTRIIPMSQDILGKFDSGQSHSQTANRTSYRGVRRLCQRNLLRRERLHRVLKILDFLPKHYKDAIDFKKHFGQFKNSTEVKLNYRRNNEGKYDFIFMDSFKEMVAEFKDVGKETKIPLDWTIYYLRKKALTQKITKEELAWVLLNFNQKRGYYQLRQEEEDASYTSKKEYHSLKVKKVIATEDKNARGTWYHVLLENDWIYKRQSLESLENWTNKIKEFIVTTQLEKDGTYKLDKEGNITRSFSAVDSEKDWIAIKKKTEQDIEQSSKTVGQYVFEKLLEKPTQKIRGKFIKTIERKFYKDELHQILETQIKFHPELKDRELFKDCIEELYPRNQAHQKNIKGKDENEMFIYLFIDDIIFYQRPLKSKKSLISNCPYEERVFIKDGVRNTQKIKCIAKSHPLFQEFRLWQFLKNLKIYQKENKRNTKLDTDVTQYFFNSDDEWVSLYDHLNTLKEVHQKNIIDFLINEKKIEKGDKKNYRWNYVEGKKYPANETKASFLSRLKKVKDHKEGTYFSDAQELTLWHIIYSVKDKNEYETALKTFALKNNLEKDSFVSAFAKYPPFKNEYGAFSEKAIKKILPLMRIGKYWDKDKITEDVRNRIVQITKRLESIEYDKEVFKGDKNHRLKTIVDDEIPKQFIKSFLDYKDKNPLSGLNTYQACYAIYERHSESGIIKPWKSPKDIDNYLNEFKQHSLRNPIVEQVVTETLRVVRDIWKYYGKGKTNFFNEIHVELGREMKNSSDKRKAMSIRNTQNNNTNGRVKSLLKELKNNSDYEIRPYSRSHQEILKIYEEGVFQNPNVSFSKVKEDDIIKIRKSNSPTTTEINTYKLWLEQGYISPYTGKIIALSKLFSIHYQIEHIIPQSRYFDNSMSNKIICETEVNKLKDNKTAYEFLKEEGGSIVTLTDGNTIRLFDINTYENHCKQYFKRNRTKLKNLLSVDIPEGFINRQLNDSRYISKIVKTLLSNIVREDGEREATANRLVPISGSITSKLKQDWRLNDQWNEIITHRFKRLNKLTKSKGFGEWDSKINAFRTKVPDEISRGFSKKRIDHRNHALDALIVACCTKTHTKYLSSLNSEKENYRLKNSLLIKNKEGHFTKRFQLPWANFSNEAKESLEKTIISFKQNLRIINKTNNKTWQWEPQNDGTFKKVLKKQKDATNSSNKTNWAIRKPMHKETVSGAVKIKRMKKGLSNITSYLDKSDLIVDKFIRRKVKSLFTLFDKDFKKIKKHLKENPLMLHGKEITKTKVFEWSENATATRVFLNAKFTRKQLESVTDSGIRTILERHLQNFIDKDLKERFDLAFNSDGIDALNKNIKLLNDGKNHCPIYKVRLFEEGSKFSVGESGAKTSKFVEAAKGTNLFFAIYYDRNKKKRVFDTIPLNKVIAHQKQTANLARKNKKPIQPDNTKGNFLFTLSPNDLVYVPTDEELENKYLVDFNNLSKEQISRVYKMVSCSGSQCFFLRNDISKSIYNKKEFLALNKMEKDIEGQMIKERCWKLKVNRIGLVKALL